MPYIQPVGQTPVKWPADRFWSGNYAGQAGRPRAGRPDELLWEAGETLTEAWIWILYSRFPWS